MARHCIGAAVAGRRPGPVHRSAGAAADDASTAATREWALAHLDEHLTVQVLARHAHMSARTFNRRFRTETGEAPGRGYRREQAKDANCWITGNIVEQVAGARPRRSRRHHRRDVMSPTGYRGVPGMQKLGLITMMTMPEPLIIPIWGRAPQLHAESWVAPRQRDRVGDAWPPRSASGTEPHFAPNSNPSRSASARISRMVSLLTSTPASRCASDQA